MAVLPIFYNDDEEAKRAQPQEPRGGGAGGERQRIVCAAVPCPTQGKEQQQWAGKAEAGKHGHWPAFSFTSSNTSQQQALDRFWLDARAGEPAAPPRAWCKTAAAQAEGKEASCLLDKEH